jgi:hypothetical protein
LLNRKESRIQNPESKKLHSNDLRAFPPAPDFASIAWTRTAAHLLAKGVEILLNSVFWLLNSGCASTIVDRTRRKGGLTSPQWCPMLLLHMSFDDLLYILQFLGVMAVSIWLIRNGRR